MEAADTYRAQARYNTWMNQRIYAACLELTDEERKRDLGAFFKSIHGTLDHLLMGDHAWLMRCTGNASRYAPRDAQGEVIVMRGYDHTLYEDFADMLAQREVTDRMIEDWVGSLTGADLAGNVKYRGLKGSYDHPLWWCVTHLFSHQAHHRGQVTTLLMQLGRDPGITDFIEHVRGTW